MRLKNLGIGFNDKAFELTLAHNVLAVTVSKKRIYVWVDFGTYTDCIQYDLDELGDDEVYRIDEGMIEQ